jgi:ubiquitin-protein ligase
MNIVLFAFSMSTIYADGIHVRVYEDRMDLLRACIIGADGTPYHDNLFFFDIFFPPDYPHEPPVSYSVLFPIFRAKIFQSTIVSFQTVNNFVKKTSVCSLSFRWPPPEPKSVRLGKSMPQPSQDMDRNW